MNKYGLTVDGRAPAQGTAMLVDIVRLNNKTGVYQYPLLTAEQAKHWQHEISIIYSDESYGLGSLTAGGSKVDILAVFRKENGFEWKEIKAVWSEPSVVAVLVWRLAK